jgi:transposase
VRRDSGEGYREMLTRMAIESGIETPTADDLTRLDRARKDKKLSNTDWESPTDPDAKIAKLKDGRTHLAYKPEHALDLDTGAVIAAEMHAADQGDTATLPGTLAAAAEHLAAIDAAPTPEAPAELVADKGYHSHDGLKALDDGPWKPRIAERRSNGVLRWHGDHDARRAVYNNRARLLSGVARQAFKLRSEWVERSFALILDRGGMRRAWLRGRENLHKRYLIHVAGYNLGLIMRLLTGAGTPREFLALGSACLVGLITPDGALILMVVAAVAGEYAILLAILHADPFA